MLVLWGTSVGMKLTVTVVYNDVRLLLLVVGDPNAFEARLSSSVTNQPGQLADLTRLISVHLNGAVTMPWRSIRNLRKGRETPLEKKTRPRNAGIEAKAYRTHRITKS